MTHFIPKISGVAIGHADTAPLGRPMSPEFQASAERQATVLQRDLDKLGLTIPASGKLAVATVDAALKDLNWSPRKRMEFKSTLHLFGVIE